MRYDEEPCTSTEGYWQNYKIRLFFLLQKVETNLNPETWLTETLEKQKDKPIKLKLTFNVLMKQRKQ